jgi:hypothetical protein
MPRSKERPFTGEMATPIRLPRMPLGISPDSSEEKEFLEKADFYVRFAQMRKIVEYAKQQGFDPKRLTGTGIAFAVTLGIDAGIPGLQVIPADHRRGRARTRKNDEDMQFLLDVIELIKRMESLDTDIAACAIWAECESPDLASPQRHKSREKRARTLRNLVIKARAAGHQPGVPILTTAKQVEASEQLMARIQSPADPLKLFAYHEK